MSKTDSLFHPSTVNAECNTCGQMLCLSHSGFGQYDGECATCNSPKRAQLSVDLNRSTNDMPITFNLDRRNLSCPNCKADRIDIEETAEKVKRCKCRVCEIGFSATVNEATTVPSVKCPDCGSNNLWFNGPALVKKNSKETPFQCADCHCTFAVITSSEQSVVMTLDKVGVKQHGDEWAVYLNSERVAICKEEKFANLLSSALHLAIVREFANGVPYDIRTIDNYTLALENAMRLFSIYFKRLK